LKYTYVIKDFLLGWVKIPRTDEDYDVESEEGKKLTSAADMNELTYNELILLIYDNTGNGKVAFNLVKGCGGQILRKWKRKYGLGEIKKQV
jgi:hypothetical protein